MKTSISLGRAAALGAAALALLIGATRLPAWASSSASGAPSLSYAFATPPTVTTPSTVTTPGEFHATVLAVASVDGPFTVDVTALDGTAIAVVDGEACQLVRAGVHCDLDASAGDQLRLGVTGSFKGHVVHLRAKASDAAGPVWYAGDTSYDTRPATLPTSPVLSAPVSPRPVSPRPVSPRPVLATPTIASTSAPAEGLVASSDLSAKILIWTNAQRAKNGLAALRVSAKLTSSAQKYADHLSADGAFSHSDGSVLEQRINAVGYRYHWIGENLGLGQTSPWSVVYSWMTSPDHRANMLDSRFTEAGVGIAKRHDGRIIWCLDFGWPR